MSKIYKVYTYLVLALSLALVACQREEAVDKPSNSEVSPSSKAFKLVSVQSSGTGQAVSLSLELDVDDRATDLGAETDGLRAKQYEQDETSGAYQKMLITEQETAHCILRRKGSPEATTYIDITWQGRSDKRIKFDKISVKLPQGVELKEGDEWYFTAIMGGASRDAQGRISMGRSDAGDIQLGKETLGQIPYFVNWTKLDLRGSNHFQIPIGAKFRPLGTLLRLQFYSNMVDAYKLKALSLRSNALSVNGVFDPMATADDALDNPSHSPQWTPSDAPNQSISQRYTLADGKSLDLPAGCRWSEERTLYLWAMPKEGADELTTEVEVELDSQTALSDLPSQDRTLSYHNSGHRRFRSGQTYRLSNVISSDLIISEIYYEYGLDGSPHRAGRHNYSIVEIYNPTLESIDLNHYALLRLVYDSQRGQYLYHRIGAEPHQSYLEATRLPLRCISGNTSDGTFGDKIGSYETGKWHKQMYGNSGDFINPGQTILLGAGGYILTNYFLNRNQREFDRAFYKQTLQASDFTHSPGTSGYKDMQARVKRVELQYYPHAGVQPDSAVKLGYCQAMRAIDNGTTPDASPSDRQGGNLQLGVGQGVALLKFVGQSSTSQRLSDADCYKIIDSSVPLGSEGVSSYRQGLLTKLNAVGAKLTSLDEASSFYYAYSRAKGHNFPRSSYDMRPKSWQVSISENTASKSLGTRDYIAGRSPFAPEYSGYLSSNSSGGACFWRETSSLGLVLPERSWTATPTSGSNAVLTPDASRIRVIRGDAPHQAGEDLSKAFDGDYSTIYHSPHDRSVRVPLDMTFYFAQAEAIDHILYTPRQSGDNGRLQRVELEYSSDGQTFVPLQTANLSNSSDTQRIKLTSNITARAIRLKVKQAVNNFASAAEIEFRRHSESQGSSPSLLFTDESYGVLRPDITPEAIQTCGDPAYRDIAMRLYRGKYEDFRVAEYKAYPDPNIVANINKTWAYSLRDNPTGISVRAGETLVVRSSADAPNLRIVVQNLDKPNSNGYGGREYPIRKGENHIKIIEGGLVYVLYFTNSIEALTSAKPIRIHFLNGRVNGYYDSQNPKLRDRWTELLAKAVDKHFDVVGKYTHLTYPTWRFREKTRDGLDLINAYDTLVHNEIELMGLYKYDKPSQGIYRTPRNRMYCHAMYESYMYALPGHTSYNDNANTLSLTGDDLRNGVWGVAHEIGHINQTRPGLTWEGMIEVTVNIFSLYIQTSVFGKESRWTKENRWETAWNTTLKDKEQHALREDGTSKITPFWQLELYFGNVLGRTPRRRADRGGFYPELFELIRTSPDQPDMPSQQTEFVYLASKVGGYDLTDFFEKWGFLKVANNEKMRYDYGRHFYLTLTQARIDEVKAKVRNLGLPKLDVALEFITDSNVDIYRRRQEVVKGTASKAGHIYTLTNWQNVVAFEVVDTANQNQVIRYIEARNTAKVGQVMQVRLPAGQQWRDSYQIRAISFSGKRTVVSL